MNKKYLVIIFLVSVSLILTTPIVLAEYFPQGKNIWFNVSPATNTTQGGVFAKLCPQGELVTGLYENGTWRCGIK